MSSEWSTYKTQMLIECWPDKMEEFFEIYPEQTRDSCRSKMRRLRRKDDGLNTVLDNLPDHITPIFADLIEQKPVDFDEAMAVSRQLKELFDEHDPIYTSITIDLDTDKPVAIVPVSCMHLGSRYTFYEEFEDFFYKILEIPRLYWAGLGDDIDGFLPKFYSAEAVVGQLYPPKFQRQLLAAVLDRLVARDKLLFGTTSEHGGQWYEKQIGENPIKDLYLQRKVPFFDGRGTIILNVGDQNYNVVVGHGLPGNSIYNYLHAQVRAARFNFPSADVIINAGKHRYAAGEFSLWGEEYDSGMREQPFVWLAEVGTAKAGPDKYTIRKWSKGTMEWPILVFFPDQKLIKVSRHLDDIRHWLQVDG